MIKKSMTTGTIIGLVITLLTLYPTFVVLEVTNALPVGVLPSLGWEIKIAVGLAVFAALNGMTMLVLLLVGSLAAWRARATTLKAGMRAGMVSGVMAAAVVYALIVAPAMAVWAGRNVLGASLPAGMDCFPQAWVVQLARHSMFSLALFLACGFLGLVVGGAEGALVGWLRRRAAPSARLSLLRDAIGDKRGRNTWFALHHEQALKAGLVVGIGVSFIFALGGVWSSAFATGYKDLAAHLPGGQVVECVVSALHAAADSTPFGRITDSALPALLVPIIFLLAISWGGLAAFMPKNPPNRLLTRVYAAVVAGAVIGLVAAFQQANEGRFLIGVLPQFVPLLRNIPGLKDSTELWGALSSPSVRVMGMYLVWIPCVILSVPVFMFWGAVQGVFFGLIFTVFRLRPVDRARRVRYDILQRGDQFLPRLYRLFQADRQAVRVLEHLAFDLKPDMPKASMAAAYYMLAVDPQNAAGVFDTTVEILQKQPEWKLRTEIAGLHELLARGLRAGTVAQIADIAPLPEDQTSTLPPLLTKAGEHLTRVLTRLKKLERVDDLASKIIFLNNTLEDLRLARIFGEEGGRISMCCTLLPEFAVFRVLLDRWEDIVLSAVKDMQGRAEITAELKTRKLTFARRLVLSIVLTNRGLNVAEQVRLHVYDDDEYDVIEGQDHRIDILPPQDSRELSVVIKPRDAAGKTLAPAPTALRLCWQVTYDDALNDDSELEFGDQVEFIEAEKSFQRIFPIPYVTGTPLQSGEMFVGRQDVFEFVREHLFGKYQNNVIVLHGQRRTGKTSILYRMGEVLADTHICILVDMQGKSARGEAEFLYSIADDIAYALENKGIAVELPPRRDFDESPEFFFRSRFLRSVYGALGGKSLLLMFDEFEELQKRVEDGKLTADIFPYLRNLMQHERKVDFVFTGTHKLEELAAEYWSILFNIAAYKKITFLEKGEVTRLVTQPVAACGLEYDPLAIERIYQVAAGHPYFTQVVCHELVAYHNETQRSYLTTTDVEASLERIVERGEAHFKYIWAESSTQQRLTLLALAELLEANDAATLDDVAKLLRKRGRPLEAGELQEAFDNLESRDIAMRSDPRSHLYRFRVDLIRRWIYASRPSYEKVI